MQEAPTRTRPSRGPSRSSTPIRKLAAWTAFCVVILAALLLFHAPILTALGNFLVSGEQPQKADDVLVLAGDNSGNRIVEGAELVRRGYASHVLVSGPPMYGRHECDFAIPFAVRAGYPEGYFVHLENFALSTNDEASFVTRELHRRGDHRVLLVTSDFHTNRAGHIFRKMAPDIQFLVIAAHDNYFSANGWWRNREGQKIFLVEWLKTIASWAGA